MKKLLGLIFLCISTFTIAQNTEKYIYQDITINYPKTWKINDSKSKIEFIDINNKVFNNVLSLQYDTTVKERRIEEYTSILLFNFMKSLGYSDMPEIILQRQISDGNSELQIVHQKIDFLTMTGVDQIERPLYVFLTVCKKNNTFYILTMSVLKSIYESDKKMFDKVLLSIE